jgi:hypothetical protein
LLISEDVHAPNKFPAPRAKIPCAGAKIPCGRAKNSLLPTTLPAHKPWNIKALGGNFGPAKKKIPCWQGIWPLGWAGIGHRRSN